VGSNFVTGSKICFCLPFEEKDVGGGGDGDGGVSLLKVAPGC